MSSMMVAHPQHPHVWTSTAPGPREMPSNCCKISDHVTPLLKALYLLLTRAVVKIERLTGEVQTVRYKVSYKDIFATPGI